MRRTMRVKLLNWRDLVGKIERDVGESKVTGARHIHREASVEAADPRDMPSHGITVGTQKAFKREIPVVTGDKAMTQVPRGGPIGHSRIARVPHGANVIQRLRVRIGEQEGDITSAAFQRSLQ